MEYRKFKIISSETIAENVKKMVVVAPNVASKAKAGQFIMVRVDEQGERIPLTVAESFPGEEGKITIIFQVVGLTTQKLATLKEGDSLLDLVGPLGTPTEVKKIGNVAVVGGGVGIAEMYPVVKAFKAEGNKVFSILGARSKELLILENELKEISDDIFVTTDDGSYSKKGFVTNSLEELLKKEKIDLVYAIGPIPMMKAVANLTRFYKLHTVVSLNSIMVDGTGMCGSCRVSVNEESKFACVHGPEFDAHQVDFDELSKRLKLFVDQEEVSKNKVS